MNWINTRIEILDKYTMSYYDLSREEEVYLNPAYTIIRGMISMPYNVLCINDIPVSLAELAVNICPVSKIGIRLVENMVKSNVIAVLVFSQHEVVIMNPEYAWHDGVQLSDIFWFIDMLNLPMNKLESRERKKYTFKNSGQKKQRSISEEKIKV